MQVSYTSKPRRLDIGAQWNFDVAPRIELIDFGALADSGCRAAIIDCDSTIADHGSEVVYMAARQAIKNAIQQGHLGAVALVSNNLNEELMKKRAEQMGIKPDLAITPKGPWDVKPTPAMIYRALKKMDQSPENTMGIGDGITDLIAYKRAKLRQAILVHPTEVKDIGGYPGRRQVRQASNFVLRRVGIDRIAG